MAKTRNDTFTGNQEMSHHAPKGRIKSKNGNDPLVTTASSAKTAHTAPTNPDSLRIGDCQKLCASGSFRVPDTARNSVSRGHRAVRCCRWELRRPVEGAPASVEGRVGRGGAG